MPAGAAEDDLALERAEGAADGLARSGLDESALARCAARCTDRARRLALTGLILEGADACRSANPRSGDEVPKGANNPAIKNMC